MKKDATIVFLIRNQHVLLAMKKRGFGQGKWNGVGGKIRAGEDVASAAIRETQEEIRVTPVLNRPLGKINFHNSSAGDWTVTVFRTEEFSGEPEESEEMKPQWFPFSAVPYGAMHSGDSYWMPLVLDNKQFEAEMRFGGNDINEGHTVREL